MNKKIQSFQGLRGIAALMIMFSHRGGYLPWLQNLELGANGVSIFIMLSGFCTYYAHHNDWNTFPSFKSSLHYTAGKLKKFYPLHLLTFLCVIPLEYIAVTIAYPVSTLFSQIITMIKRAVPNLFLIHSFIPDSNYYFSYNQTSWYLSDTLFFCLFTPLIVYLLNKLTHTVSSKNITKHQSGKRICFIIPIILFLVCLFTQFTLGILLLNSQYAHAILYISPLYRIIDFTEGCLLGNIFINHKAAISRRICSIFEITSVICFISFVILWSKFPVELAYCALYVPVTAFLLYSLAFDNGIVSHILRLKPFTYLGNISFELFLVHLVVFRYLDCLREHLPPVSDTVYVVVPVCLALLAGMATHSLLKSLSHIHRNP